MPTKKEKVKNRIVSRGIIASTGSLISLAPSPFGFYKPTTKFDSVPRAAPADGGTWGDLERAVEMHKVSDEPERGDTIKVKDTRKGMFDRKVIAPDMSMMAATVSPPNSPPSSPKLRARR